MAQMEQQASAFWMQSTFSSPPDKNASEFEKLSYFYYNLSKVNPAVKGSAVGLSNLVALYSIQKEQLKKNLEQASSTVGVFQERQWKLPVKNKIAQDLWEQATAGENDKSQVENLLDNKREEIYEINEINTPLSSSFGAGVLLVSGGLVADDTTVIGVADDVLIPVVLVVGAIVYIGLSIYEKSTEKKESSEEEADKSEGDSETEKKVMTNKEADKAAAKLGYKETGEYSHGQKVYKKGKKYITQDVDAHNGGTWKMADSVKNLGSKKTRMGTYDSNLKRIGD